MNPWTAESIPDLAGRRALVTGAASPIGREVAAELLAHHAEVLLASRPGAHLDETVERLRSTFPQAQLHAVPVDLAQQDSVRGAATLAASFGPLNLLVAAAGIGPGRYERTGDGFTLPMAVNHFGHFTLTGMLWPQLVEGGAETAARVVAVTARA
ncbi:MAG: SDR family NAD(P)-dependent oxidoreductase, partial [Nocardioidaceae bacterium]|nr:SDR family NAD(P)-dependent oxidoreductase [Nocardioidaceae bacterium]